jgi:uncharacterized protein (TIRG00374 family)
VSVRDPGSRPGAAPSTGGPLERLPVTTGTGVVLLGFVLYATTLVLAARYWELPPLGLRALVFLGLALIAEFAAKLALAALFLVGLRSVGHQVSRRAAFAATLTSTAVARLVPAGGALTPATMAWTVRREDDEAAGAALRVTVLTYGGLLAMTGGAILWGTTTGRHPLLFAGALAFGSVLLILGLAVLAGTRWLGAIVDRLPQRLRDYFGPTAESTRASIVELVLVAVRVSIEASVLWFSLHAVGIELTPSKTMVAFGVSTIVGGLPGTPGGLGMVEGGLIGVLTAFGFPARTVVAPALIYRVIDYWIPAGVGLAAGAVVTARNHREVREAADAATGSGSHER